MKRALRCVDTLIFVSPARMPRAMCSSETPEEPCSTSGTGTARGSRAMSSRSIAATRSVMACEEPTATASASTPVSATNRAASSGSVRTPGACAPSLPPISPSSASTSTPAASRAAATTRRVVATLSAKSSFAPSYITEPKPASMARSASSGSSAWSRCTATIGARGLGDRERRAGDGLEPRRDSARSSPRAAG